MSRRQDIQITITVADLSLCPSSKYALSGALQLAKGGQVITKAAVAKMVSETPRSMHNAFNNLQLNGWLRKADDKVGRYVVYNLTEMAQRAIA